MAKISGLLKMIRPHYPHDWQQAIDSATRWIDGGIELFENFRPEPKDLKPYSASLADAFRDAKSLGFDLSWDDDKKCWCCSFEISQKDNVETTHAAMMLMLKRMNELLIRTS